MRILEVIQSLASGGAERLVTDLCNELSKTEEVTVLILKDVEHFYLPQLSPKVKVLEAKMPLGGSIRQLVQCCKWVNRIKPDVVHVLKEGKIVETGGTPCCWPTCCTDAGTNST